jgi:hypothetical protein
MIDRFLDPNRKQVLPKNRNKRDANFKELMETYTIKELRAMKTKRYYNSGHLRHISLRFKLEDAECVVDMGSGCCFFEGHIKNLVNLDIFPYPGVNLLNDMRQTQLKDNVADGIICIGSHVWMEHTNEVMDEIYRISKPECIMFCKTNSIALWEYIDWGKGYAYDKEKIVEWIKSRHEVAEGPYFTKKKDKKRVDKLKDMVDWAWIL